MDFKSNALTTRPKQLCRFYFDYDYELDFCDSKKIIFNCQIFFQLLTHAVFPNLWQFTPLKKFYQTQGREQKLDFNARVTAAIHASVVFAMSLYNILAVDDFVYTDVYR